MTEKYNDEIEKFWDNFIKKFKISNDTTKEEKIKELKKELLNILNIVYEKNEKLEELSKEEEVLKIILDNIEEILNKIDKNNILQEDYNNLFRNVNDNIEKLNIQSPEIKEKIKYTLSTLNEKIEKDELEMFDIEEQNKKIEILLKEIQNILKDISEEVKSQKQNIKSNKKLKRAIEMIVYIINNHPLSGTRMELMENSNGEHIKYETLLGQELAFDDILKETILNKENIIGSFMNLILNRKIANTVGISVAKTNLKSVLLDMSQNPNQKDIKYSINISEAELMDVDFIRILKEKQNVLRNRIEFEFLEYPINFKNEKIIRNIAILYKSGYNFNIDDFGTNASNKARIKDLKILEEKLNIQYTKSKYGNSLISGIKIDGEILAPVIFEDYLNSIKTPISQDDITTLITQYKNLISYADNNNKNTENIEYNQTNKSESFETQFNNIKESFEKIKQSGMYETIKKAANETINFVFASEELKNSTIIFEFIGDLEIKKILEEKLKDNEHRNILFQGYYNKEDKKVIVMAEYFKKLKMIKTYLKSMDIKPDDKINNGEMLNS